MHLPVPCISNNRNLLIFIYFKQKVSSRLYSRFNAVENFHLSKMSDDLDASEEVKRGFEIVCWRS